MPHTHLRYDVLVFKEGDTFVAYSPQLDVSSCGETPQQAREMVKEAIALFLEELESQGILEDVLIESGFIRRQDGMWSSPPLQEIAVHETI